jgi:hypothetical protein
MRSDGNRCNYEVEMRAHMVYQQAVQRFRAALECIQRAIESLGMVRGRKSVIMVSGGFIMDRSHDEFRDVIGAAQRANASIYFLDVRGLSAMPSFMTAQFGTPIDAQDFGATMADESEASAGAEALAADSGGFSVKNTNDISAGMQRIAQESQTYYLIGYHPTHTRRDGKFRRIEVKSARKGVTVRARKGYFAPDKDSGLKPISTDIEPKRSVADYGELRQAMASPFAIDEIPLSMTAFVRDANVLGKTKVAVLANVDTSSFVFEKKDDRLNDAFEMLLMVTHRETLEYAHYQQRVKIIVSERVRAQLLKDGYLLEREFDLLPGGYQAKLVIREEGRGKIGTVTHEFEVPKPTGLRLATPVLTDRRSEDGRQALAVTYRGFPAHGRLFCQYEVLGAAVDPTDGAPRVTSGYVMRSLAAGEQAVMAPTPIRSDRGRVMRMIGLNLDDLPPGDYELTLIVKDEVANRVIETVEPFTLIAPTAVVAPASGGAP